jgi:hypothetical protein
MDGWTVRSKSEETTSSKVQEQPAWDCNPYKTEQVRPSRPHNLMKCAAFAEGVKREERPKGNTCPKFQRNPKDNTTRRATTQPDGFKALGQLREREQQGVVAPPGGKRPVDLEEVGKIKESPGSPLALKTGGEKRWFGGEKAHETERDRIFTLRQAAEAGGETVVTRDAAPSAIIVVHPIAGPPI